MYKKLLLKQKDTNERRKYSDTYHLSGKGLIATVFKEYTGAGKIGHLPCMHAIGVWSSVPHVVPWAPQDWSLSSDPGISLRIASGVHKHKQKEYAKFNYTNTNTTIKIVYRSEKSLFQRIHPGDKQTHGNCSESLFIMEMQIKIKYHLTAVRMGYIKKTRSIWFNIDGSVGCHIKRKMSERESYANKNCSHS